MKSQACLSTLLFQTYPCQCLIEGRTTIERSSRNCQSYPAWGRKFVFTIKNL